MIRIVQLAVLLASSSVALAAGTSTSPSGFDASSIDKSVDPCTDFYAYVCGSWLKKNPIPPDQSHWGRSDVMGEENLAVLRGLLENAAKAKKRDADTQRLGDFYSSCMDEKGIAKKGLTPLEPTLTRIAALEDKKQLPALLASLHAQGAGGFFEVIPFPDFKNASVNLAAILQGGLGLPDQAYYTREDPKATETREKYAQHVRRTFELAGDKPEAAAAKAQVVMSLETKLAKDSLDVVSRRDPSKQYHKMTVAELQVLSPGFDWRAYFDAADGAPKLTDLNVAWPDYIKAMDAALTATSLDDLKTYLTWHALHAASPLLPEAFVKEHFDFFGKTLRGAKQLEPRWKRCVKATDGALGEALGRAYVEKTFGAEGKARVLAMVHGLEKALERDIKQLDWMGEQTKMAALAKLAAIDNKIGYPDKWRDYSALVVKPGDALGNVERANAFETRRQLKKIDQPVDRTEWAMTPPTVNAYYNEFENNINFPAGVLQPPLFLRTADDGINYGGLGAIIGHELTHAFDDMGRQFDGQGNLRDWWTADDSKRFNERTQCFVDQYGRFVAVDDVKVDGKLTLGENCADNGGLRIARMALEDANTGKKPAPIDGYTQEQRLFVGWGQVWCQNVTPEAARMRAQTDPHSPGRYRVNGVVQNMPEFQRAFGCKPAEPTVKQCRVW